MKLNVGESYGTKRIYATVYPHDVIVVGFNTRWGGYYISLIPDGAVP